jgi:hypothetical protein
MGITLLAIPFIWIGCMGTLIFPIMILAGVGRMFWDLLTPYLFHSKAFGLAVTTLLLMIWLGAYVLYAFLGFGLWKLRKWALKGSVIVHVFAIFLGLIAVIVLLKYEPLMALPMGIGLIAPYAGILWYLRRPNVQAAFGISVPTTTPSVPTAPPKPKKTWVIVVIAISVCVVLLAMFIGGVFFAVDKSFRQSGIYSISLDRARNSPCVIAKLGSPLIAKGMIAGNINTQGSEGSADMEIPVHGSKGSGSLNVSGKKVDGGWNIDSLTLMDDEGQIQLLPIPSACP